MNVVVIIAGREAIPVRAIPHVTRRTITPDTLCKFLGHEDVLKRLLEVSVYSIQPPDGFAPYPPTAWDAISDSLQDLSTNLKAKENSGRTTRQDWRQQSPLKLPAGVFVWRDEFEPVYRRQWKGVFDDRAMERLDEGLAERAGERDLHLDCTSAERDVFVEGFESVSAPAEVQHESEEGTSSTATVDWIARVRALAIEYIARHKEQDLYPTQDDVCKHLTEVAREKKNLRRSQKSP